MYQSLALCRRGYLELIIHMKCGVPRVHVCVLFFDNQEMKDINEFANVVCCAMIGHPRKVFFFFFFLLNYVTARLISSTLSLCTLGSRYIFPHLFCSVVCKRYWCIVLLLSSDSKRSSIILRGIVKRVVDQSCSCVKCFGHVSAIYYMYIYVFCFHPVESIYGTLFMLLLMVFCVHMHGMLQPLSNQRNHLIWVELQGEGSLGLLFSSSFLFCCLCSVFGIISTALSHPRLCP